MPAICNPPAKQGTTSGSALVKGCLIGAAVVMIGGIALVVAGYFAFQHYTNKFTDDQPMALPVVEMDQETYDALAERAEGVLEKHPPLFRTVLPRWYGPFVGNAGWYYREREFRVLQCFWPDVDGILPWESGFDGAWVGKQPLLFEEDESTALGAPLAALLREEGAL